MTIRRVTLGIIGFVLVSSVAMLGASPTAKVRALDPEFAKWVASEKQPTYGEVVHHFLRAAGRSATAYDAALARLEAELRSELGKLENPDDPHARCTALARCIFQHNRYAADADLGDLQNLYPDAILERHRGYCLGLSLVLLHLGERLSWPLAAASAPRHTFVRYRANPPIDIETTRNGELHDDRWYTKRFASTGARKVVHVLTPRQTAAHLLNNHGFVLLENRNFSDAAREFHQALDLYDQLVEAMINLGVLRARQGRFEDAIRHFDDALRHWPADPAIRLNRANALVSQGHKRDGAREILKLLGDAPGLRGLDEASHEARETLDPERDWNLVQKLSIARNASIEKRLGREPGLRATYFSDSDLRTPVVSRIDADIAFQWNWGSPDRKVPPDHFSARWTGWLEVPADDQYTFFITSSDGVRIWIDGRQVVNSWERANNSFSQGSIDLLAGLHDLRVEYFESIGEAGIMILCTAEKREKAIPLKDHFYHEKPAQQP